jgi:peptide/nickel transport system substrate-binding protein
MKELAPAMKKPLRTLICLVLGTLALAGCTDAGGKNSSSGGSVEVLHVGSPAVSTMDYSKSTSAYEHEFGDLLLEPLMVLDENYQVQPWLAESVDTPDPKTYVYHVRQGVKFTSGNELTSEDVVFSLDYYRRPGSTSAYNFPATLKSIKALDPYTVEIKFSEPNAAWAVVPTGTPTGIFEKAFYEANEKTFGKPGTGIVGTAPWSLESFDPTTGAEFKANPDYWGGDVEIESIDWKFFSNENSAALAFRAGQIDAYYPQDNRGWAATAGAEPLVSEDGSTQAAFTMNTLNEPWDDVHVRRAVAYALDKETLIKAWGGYATPLPTIIPKQLLLQLGDEDEVDAALETVPQYDHDVEKAKAEMAQSAYADGVDVTLAVNNTPGEINVSQAIVPMLKEIGINATLEVEQTNPWLAQLTSGDRESIPSQFWTGGGVNPDPGAAYGWMFGSANATKGNWNVSNWSTPENDELLAQGLATTDPAQRLEIYQGFLAQYGENVPFLPLFLTNATIALSDKYSYPSFSAFDRGPWPLGLEAKQ